MKPASSERTRTRAICRYCAVSCGVFMEIENGRVVSVIGDKDDPAYHGFTCKKGRDLPNHLYHPSRLLQPLRRSEGGEFEPAASGEVISEIAERLRAIIDEHGPESVALYSGTYALGPPVSMLTDSFMHALGSPMSFGCGTIDQPGKIVTPSLHGRWRGGDTAFADAETWLFIGTNPVVSKLGGLPTINPGWHLTRALKRGIKIIVIDPRRTETARKAALHLQPRPGEDATILAGMIRIVLEEGLHDEAFVAESARGLETLRAHVAPYTPDVVEARADIPADALLEATRVFASSATGGANAGTGPNMAPRGLLTEYLLACLLTLCGFRPRAGDRVPNPGVVVPRGPRRAQPIAPKPAWGYPPLLRFHGLTNTACGLPTAILPHEMLKPGKGQVRALICMGGNPMMAWPDQIKTREALEGLDLLVVLDPKLTQTGRLAHYVLPPKLVPEIPAFSFDIEELEGMGPGWGYPVPYAAYRDALIDPPEGSDLMEDWQFFYRVAQELGLQLTACAGRMRIEGDPPMRFFPLDMETMPTTDELFELLTTESRVPLAEVRKYEAGRLYEVEEEVVLPREADCDAYFELADATMMGQLDEAARDVVEGDGDFAFRLLNRRQADTLNSQGRDQAKLCRERPHNPVHIHPEDMRALGIEAGMLVAITSRRATIYAFAKPEEELRRGVVSMSHSYGLDPAELGPDAPDGAPQPYSMGGHTGALASADLDYIEPFTGIPRMSAIPVEIAPAPDVIS